jgi:hypothetical protein
VLLTLDFLADGMMEAELLAQYPPLHDFGRFRTVSTRAREGECELGTLAIGKRCQERISATGCAFRLLDHLVGKGK